MPKYMMFIKHTEAHRGMSPPTGLYEAMGAFVQEGFKSGILKDTAGLKPTKDGKRVDLKGGKITITNGPFADSKETVGGYALVEVASDAEALKVASEFMEVHRIHWPGFEGLCEVRPLEDM